ncbi:transmembrane protein 14 homolog [Oscarella lobularis]|uniref:transmembrane protein 14 homolog n=1 Tax=Oscarella lobularis TaxID=121494 RepID=UPI0033140F4C
MARSSIDYVSLAYAIVVAFGGIAGYAKAGSLPSLAFGLAFGVMTAAAVVAAPGKPYIVLGLSLVLLVFMGMRFFRTKKFMPAGVVALLSLAQVIRLSFQYVKG